MNKRSKSTLFLMEQLIAILVFAICSSASVTILADSHLTAEKSRDTRNSLLIAESAAECYKSAGGDKVETALLLGAKASATAEKVVVYYDIDRQVVDVGKAYYVLELADVEADGFNALSVGSISVKRYGGEELFALSVAARGGGL